MTPQEIVSQGLAASMDAALFRAWADKWLPGIKACPDPEGRTDPIPLEVMAFRAREMAGKDWLYALEFVGSVVGNESLRWVLFEATPCQWIIASCVALEIKKGA
jgi:hypothetical protein